jgi:AAA+ ATPase superfamily predicted ATPase
MRLPFLDRSDELSRIKTLLDRTDGTLGILYGRRRLGKSRLLEQTLPPTRSVYYVGDERESAPQRASLATEIGRRIQGFDIVTYPDWDVFFSRWWQEADAGSVLALDEFPALVSAAREVPSLIQKNLERHRAKGCHLLHTGSSQRMMQGLVPDRTQHCFWERRVGQKTSILPLFSTGCAGRRNAFPWWESEKSSSACG